MQSILYLLRGQVIKLQIEIRKAESKKSPDKLSSVKNWGLLRFKLLKSICEALWGICLLKTSILVTKTPLTTLKSLSHNYFDPALMCNLKSRILKGIHEIQEALVGALASNLKLKLKKLKRIQDKADLKALS